MYDDDSAEKKFEDLFPQVNKEKTTKAIARFKRFSIDSGFGTGLGLILLFYFSIWFFVLVFRSLVFQVFPGFFRFWFWLWFDFISGIENHLIFHSI